MRTISLETLPMPPRRPPSLLALRAFEAAARRLSFTDAARELHVSQAAISRHVRALEKDVGRELFRRLHRAVELTAPGKHFAAELAAGFLRIHRAVEAVRGVTTRRLRLTVEPGFAARWLVPRLGSFSAAHPEMELEIETSDELRILGRDADVAIRYLSIGAPRPRTRIRRLFSIDGIPVVAGVRPRPPRLQHDAAVLGYRLLHDDDGRVWRSWFASAGQDGFERAKHLYFTDYSLAIAAALQGHGVALAATAFVEQELKSGRLVRIGNTRASYGEYVLLETRDRSTAAGRAAFVRWLDTEISRMTPTGAAAHV